MLCMRKKLPLGMGLSFSNLSCQNKEELNCKNVHWDGADGDDAPTVALEGSQDSHRNSVTRRMIETSVLENGSTGDAARGYALALVPKNGYRRATSSFSLFSCCSSLERAPNSFTHSCSTVHRTVPLGAPQTDGWMDHRYCKRPVLLSGPRNLLVYLYDSREFLFSISTGRNLRV